MVKTPIQGGPLPDVELPPKLWMRFCEFLLTKRSGSVQWNIRDGKILGMTLNEHLNEKSP